MNAPTKTQTPPPPAPPRYKRPIIGSDVHFYDASRAQQYANPGAGPYAAKVVLIEPRGVHLKVFAPHAVFDAGGVPHRLELDPKAPPNKKFWVWPHEKPDGEVEGK